MTLTLYITKMMRTIPLIQIHQNKGIGFPRNPKDSGSIYVIRNNDEILYIGMSEKWEGATRRVRQHIASKGIVHDHLYDDRCVVIFMDIEKIREIAESNNLGTERKGLVARVETFMIGYANPTGNNKDNPEYKPIPSHGREIIYSYNGA